jgi:hypothetical protein
MSSACARAWQAASSRVAVVWFQCSRRDRSRRRPISAQISVRLVCVVIVLSFLVLAGVIAP